MRTQTPNAIDQWVAYIMAWRPMKTLIYFRLKGEKSENMINVLSHALCPTGTPRPNTGTYIINNHDMGTASANAARYCMGKLRTVNENKHVRGQSFDSVCNLINPSH
jgi:hypothetical protein